MPTKWRLKEFLDQHDLTVAALIQVTGLSSNTLYPLARGETSQVGLETLGKIILGLEALTGVRPKLEEIMEVTPE